MKIGISALIFNLKEAIQICKEIEEISHIEIGIDNLDEYEILLKYKEQIIKNNISIGIHLPMEINSCENIEYIRNAWIEYILQSHKKLNNKISIKYFNMHLGYVISSRVHKNEEKYLNNSINFLNNISGKMDIPIYIENVYSKNGDISNVGNKVSQFKYIFNKTKKIKFCYDNGHDLINKDDYINQLKTKIELVHLSDNNGIDDLHYGLKKGIMTDDEIDSILDLNPNYLVLEMNHEYIRESMNIINYKKKKS